MSPFSPLRLRPFIRICLTLATVASALTAAQAQPTAPGGRPPVELTLRSRTITSSDLGSSGASVSQSSVGFAAKVPLPVTRSVHGELAVSLDLFELNFNRFSQTTLGTASPLSRGKVATISPSLTFLPAPDVVVFAGPQWEFSGANGADPNAATAWSATVGAVWLYRPDLTLVGGFVFSERLGYSTQYLPIAGFNWQINDTWALGLTGSAADYQAPVLKLTRTVNPTLKLYTQLGFESGTVRLSPDAPIPSGTLRYKAVVPLLGVEWQVTPQFGLSVFGGVQLDQQYDFKNRAQQLVLREKADRAPILGLRLSGKF